MSAPKRTANHPGWIDQRALEIAQGIAAEQGITDVQQIARIQIGAIEGIKSQPASLADTRADAWQDIATAPYCTPVRTRAGHMTFEAALWPDVSENDEGQSCDQWQAVHEGEHPPCWSDGACWSSNVDEVMSLQPDAWMPLAPSDRGDAS